MAFTVSGQFHEAVVCFTIGGPRGLYYCQWSVSPWVVSLTVGGQFHQGWFVYLFMVCFSVDGLSPWVVCLTVCDLFLFDGLSRCIWSVSLLVVCLTVGGLLQPAQPREGHFVRTRLNKPIVLQQIPYEFIA